MSPTNYTTVGPTEVGTLFPLDRQLEINDLTKPLTHTGTLRVYLKLAEDSIFLQGFDEHSREGRPPALLRGSLVLRVLKPAKIKTIALTFKGVARTEWPEGIPPKKNEYIEETVVMNHTWPFYTQSTDRKQSGADMFSQQGEGLHSVSLDTHLSHEDVSSLSLDTMVSRGNNPLAILKRVTSPERARSSSILSTMSNETSSNTGEHFTFEPGDYVYNFEHPIQSSTPETITATFGSVKYYLEVNIERQGAFKSNITSRMPVNIIRAQIEESVEDTEPIAISRDWEDQLHYDILIASKSMVLNAYIPIAFKLIPLDKIKLHRIRVYVTENVEYYCRNKKVHRMEPTRKYLLLEHKAPPPTDLPANADAKLKRMGNLLTSDGYDLTAKEFEFQVFVPQKLTPAQRLHPNTSYCNIKTHHWIKICLRISRVIDGKPKHYEISIDSPIHVLDAKCSHANTLLPAYGTQNIDTEHPVHHDSNIYFPKEILNSPPLSPEVEAVDNTHRSIYLALSSDNHSNRSRSSSTLSHSLPNFESTMSANLYKPEDLNIGLTSPQAVPLSPMLSPMLSITSDPNLFDDDIPPPFEDGFYALSTIIPTGIDAIMDSGSPPPNPPSYEEIMQIKRSPLLLTMQNPSLPEIQLTRSSTRSLSPGANQDGDANDLASDFQFDGSSAIMPSAVMRATSPHAQMVRASVRSAASTPRASLDLNRGDLQSSSVIHDIDGLLSDHENYGVDSYHPANVVGGLNNHLSPRSSISSVEGRAVYDDEDIADMAPLLHQTTTMESIIDPVRYDPSGFQSVESFGRRESTSADLSGLYQSPQHMFTGSSIFEPPVPSARASVSSIRRPSYGRRRSSAQTVNPVMAILNGEPTHEERILEETDSNKSKSDSSLFNNDKHRSSSTLASGEPLSLPKAQLVGEGALVDNLIE